MNRRIGLVAAGGLAAALVAIGGTALAASTSPVSSAGTITGCYSNAEVSGAHAVELQNGGTNCPSGWSAISWNQTGPAGPQGPAGPAGPTGATGAAGAAGATGATGPQGLQGTPGINGSNGSNGASIVVNATLSDSCTTGDTDIDLATGEVYSCVASAWSDDSYSIEGPAGPQGPVGPAGPAGATGATGAAGTNGASPAVTAFTGAEGTCTNGGDAITDANGNVTYVCNGAPGTAGTGAPDIDWGYIFINVSTEDSGACYGSAYGPDASDITIGPGSPLECEIDGPWPTDPYGGDATFQVTPVGDAPAVGVAAFVNTGSDVEAVTADAQMVQDGGLQIGFQLTTSGGQTVVYDATGPGGPQGEYEWMVIMPASSS